MEELFKKLYSLDVSGKTEEKNGLTYLSWAWAWAEFKKACPDATYEIVKFDNGLPYAYDEATGFMVYTRVTAKGVTHEMWLPVMDGANKAMKSRPYEYTVYNKNFKYAKLGEDGKYRDKYGNEQPEFLVKKCEAATMFDVNKTIMRCLTKNLAMFGLGLYIYAGEDLPEPPPKEYKCCDCGKPFEPFTAKTGQVFNAGQVYHMSMNRNTDGKARCSDCMKKAGTDKKAIEAEKKKEDADEQGHS